MKEDRVFTMSSCPPRKIPADFVPHSPRAGSHLTTEEWNLILKALSAYQHNDTYRSLYDKLAHRPDNLRMNL